MKAELKPIPPTDPRFKAFVLDKQLKTCRLKVGDKVKIRGTNKCGEVVEIIADPERAAWQNNSPHFVAIKIHPSGEEFLAAPRQLKKRR